MDTEYEKGLNANQLKVIAIAAMTLDHLVYRQIDTMLLEKHRPVLGTLLAGKPLQ